MSASKLYDSLFPGSRDVTALPLLLPSTSQGRRVLTTEKTSNWGSGWAEASKPVFIETDTFISCIKEWGKVAGRSCFLELDSNQILLKSYNKMLTGVHYKNPEGLQDSEVPSESSEGKKKYIVLRIVVCEMHLFQSLSLKLGSLI